MREAHSCVQVCVLKKRKSENRSRLALTPDFGNRRKVHQTDFSPREITRDGIIFPYQRDMVHDGRPFATHTCRPGNANAGYFPSGKKTFASALNLQRIALRCGKFELRSLYRIDSISGRVEEGEGSGEASGYTSDKWWIGNKWGILTGNIRDIKKEPCTPRDVSRTSRDWNLTLPYYPNRTKGTFGEIWNIRVIPSTRPRLNPFWEKKTHDQSIR